MKFSVGITHYNETKKLLELLDCIQSSSVKPDLVIIVDDFSVPLTELKKLIDNHFCFELLIFQNEKNHGGPAMGRNLCLSKSREFDMPIFLFDADDLVPEFYFEQVIKSLPNSALPMVYSPRRKLFRCKSEIGLLAAESNMTENIIFNSEEIMLKWGVNPFTLSGSFFSLPFLKCNIEFPVDTAVEDLHLWLRLIDAKMISLTDFYIYYRLSSGQISGNKIKHSLKVIWVFFVNRKSAIDFSRKVIGYISWHVVIKKIASRITLPLWRK